MDKGVGSLTARCAATHFVPDFSSAYWLHGKPRAPKSRVLFDEHLQRVSLQSSGSEEQIQASDYSVFILAGTPRISHPPVLCTPPGPSPDSFRGARGRRELAHRSSATAGVGFGFLVFAKKSLLLPLQSCFQNVLPVVSLPLLLSLVVWPFNLTPLLCFSGVTGRSGDKRLCPFFDWCEMSQDSHILLYYLSIIQCLRFLRAE